MMGQDQADVAAWLDKCLIKLCARFAGYTQEQADTFQLPDNFSMVPQWIFNLRRSPFMQVPPPYTHTHNCIPYGEETVTLPNPPMPTQSLTHQQPCFQPSLSTRV